MGRKKAPSNRGFSVGNAGYSLRKDAPDADDEPGAVALTSACPPVVLAHADMHTHTNTHTHTVPHTEQIRYTSSTPQTTETTNNRERLFPEYQDDALQL